MNDLRKATTYEGKPFGKVIRKVAEMVNPIVEKAIAGKKLKISEYLVIVLAIWVVFHRNGENNSKLDGGASVSTEVHDNIYCIARMKLAMEEIAKQGWTNIICADCYAESMQRQYAGLSNRNKLNGFILRNVLIPKKAWKHLNLAGALFYRVQSFGDVENVTEARNLLRSCPSYIPCAIWSKNAGIWAEAFRLEGGKPKNVMFVWSSLRINVIEEVPECIKEWCDHRFTVFSPEYLKEHPEIVINCGGRSCKSCLLCYKKNNTFDIFEVLK